MTISFRELTPPEQVQNFIKYLHPCMTAVTRLSIALRVGKVKRVGFKGLWDEWTEPDEMLWVVRQAYDPGDIGHQEIHDLIEDIWNAFVTFDSQRDHPQFMKNGKLHDAGSLPTDTFAALAYDATYSSEYCTLSNDLSDQVIRAGANALMRDEWRWPGWEELPPFRKIIAVIIRRYFPADVVFEKVADRIDEKRDFEFEHELRMER